MRDKKIVIQICMDNAIFKESRESQEAEIKRLLELSYKKLMDCNCGTLYDINGNPTGYVTVEYMKG